MRKEIGFDLQLFAEEGQEEEQEGEHQDGQQGDQDKQKTYTEEEVQELIQKESDRRVTEAIKKREQALREEMEEKIRQEREEAERLAQLSEKEKEKELVEKQKQEIEKREREIKRKELLSDTKDILYEKGIPTKFAEVLVKEDAETTHKAINDFEEEWKQAIDQAVEEKLKGRTPRAGGDRESEENPWLPDQFNLTKQGRLIQQDPERAERLKKQAGVK